MTVAPRGQTLVVVSANRAAQRASIREGRTLADARALDPDVRVIDDEPKADRAALETLAAWANCLSPIVHLEDERTLLVDVTGCAKLFRGEPRLLAVAREGVEARGFTVRAAIADTPGAAWALARAHGEATVIAPAGESAAFLAPLPVWSLRIPPAVASTLTQVGVEKIESLLHLPRASLATRFGDTLLARIDQALGDLPEPLVPFNPPRTVCGTCRLATPSAMFDPLWAATTEALRTFCTTLRERGEGAREVFVTWSGEETSRPPETRSVLLSEPTRAQQRFEPLLRVLLEQWRMAHPVISVAVWTRDTDALDDWQQELFATGRRDHEQIARLVDRLAVRLGPAAVVRPRLRDDHQPENAYRYEPFTTRDRPHRPAKAPLKTASKATDKPPPESPPDGVVRAVALRPLRLLERPRRIGADTLLPDARPVALRFDGRRHEIVGSAGPERIETGWWRGPYVRRDYFRVRTNDGRRLWVFQDVDSRHWFLHGWFD